MAMFALLRHVNFSHFQTDHFFASISSARAKLPPSCSDRLLPLILHAFSPPPISQCSVWMYRVSRQWHCLLKHYILYIVQKERCCKILSYWRNFPVDWKQIALLLIVSIIMKKNTAEKYKNELYWTLLIRHGNRWMSLRARHSCPNLVGHCYCPYCYYRCMIIKPFNNFRSGLGPWFGFECNFGGFESRCDQIFSNAHSCNWQTMDVLYSWS